MDSISLFFVSLTLVQLLGAQFADCRTRDRLIYGLLFMLAQIKTVLILSLLVRLSTRFGRLSKTKLLAEYPPCVQMWLFTLLSNQKQKKNALFLHLF